MIFFAKALVGFQGRGWADVIQPNCCHPFLLDALLFQWPYIRRCASRTMLEHKPLESNKSDDNCRTKGVLRCLKLATNERAPRGRSGPHVPLQARAWRVTGSQPGANVPWRCVRTRGALHAMVSAVRAGWIRG